MPKPMSEFMSLFGSIKPDDSEFQASKSAAANEAAKRWPLFKALPPEKPEPTPPLSEQDRARWDSQEASGARVRQSVLSVPTTSFDMASSLKRMAVIKQHPDAASPLVTPKPSIKTENKLKKMPPPATTPPQALQASNHWTSEVVGTNPNTVHQQSVRSRPFVDHVPHSQASTTAKPEPVANINSLAVIFNRLEGKKEALAKPSPSLPSFFGRLGRR